MSVHRLLVLGGKPDTPLAPLSGLEGLGAKRLAALNREGIFDRIDLLLRIPRRYEDRRIPQGFETLYKNQGRGRVCTRVKVLETEFFYARGKRTPKIWVDDGGGNASLLCFGRPFLGTRLTPGSHWLFAGDVVLRRGELQSSSFEVLPEEEAEQFFRIVPSYSPVDAIYPTILRRLYSQALDEAGSITDLYGDALDQLGLPRIGWALEHIHRPKSPEDIDAARRRLAYGELRNLHHDQQKNGKRAEIRTEPVGRADGGLLQKELIASLGFPLTEDQLSCVSDINRELLPGRGMYRLLQGDVGSGKTLVALLAALRVVENGEQVAFMVPTEILARQHKDTIQSLLAGIASRDLSSLIYMFIAAMEGSERKAALEAMTAGSSGIWIGTHSLFGEKVDFANLGLVIIDEQHRFGVNQREQLRSKASLDRVLLLSATPIPRTLTLTLFGNMDISTIRTMPSGRLPVSTHLAVMGKEEKVYTEVEKHLARGQQAYFVYPRIEDEGDEQVLKSAEEMHRQLRRRFPAYAAGLVHGKQTVLERQQEMQAFVEGKYHILVATTVIEVGVDVPNASVMVIEHAERFGLAALHQLRGRVGRGSVQSYCYLIYDSSLTPEARERLRVMKEHRDGFALAEADLRIRGPGSIAGVEQSGYLRLEFASLHRDIDLIEAVAKGSYRI